ncbi:hypothetical protein PENVUL_c023G07247 [Penicillium vulpinum]|uniref:Uncharacterized protein n=1 Tax=Penicillium vulpinum TaxID=29845 RepID=A0A1V6RVS0_9EURO|nr:hypothetical protein PENVUL_c023G07247 [Penicillium vulpinum]
MSEDWWMGVPVKGTMSAICRLSMQTSLENAISGRPQNMNLTVTMCPRGLSRKLSPTKGQKTKMSVPGEPSVSKLASYVQKECTIDILDACK